MPVHRYDSARNEYVISESQKSDTVTICELPHPSYVWHGDPKNDALAKKYKDFLGIDESVQFQFVKYSDFKTE